MEILPGAPQLRVWTDTGPDLGPYLSRRSPGGLLGGGGGLRSPSPPCSERQSGGCSSGSAPPGESRDLRSGQSVLWEGRGVVMAVEIWSRGLETEVRRAGGRLRGAGAREGRGLEAAGGGGGLRGREAGLEETQSLRSRIWGPAHRSFGKSILSPRGYLLPRRLAI